MATDYDTPRTTDTATEDIRVLPAQADEFTCTSCYLVQHRSQLADQGRGVCRECTA